MSHINFFLLLFITLSLNLTLESNAKDNSSINNISNNSLKTSTNDTSGQNITRETEINNVGKKIQYISVEIGIETPTYKSDSSTLHGLINFSIPLISFSKYNLLGWYQEYGLFFSTGSYDYENKQNDELLIERNFGIYSSTGLSMLIGKPEAFSLVPFAGVGTATFKEKDYSGEEAFISVSALAKFGLKINFNTTYWISAAYEYNYTFQENSPTNSMFFSIGVGGVPNRR